MAYDYRTLPGTYPNSYDCAGLLAPSVLCFQHTKNIIQTSFGDLEDVLRTQASQDADFTVTNLGVRICLPLQLIDRKHKLYMAFLSCGTSSKYTIYAIYLRQISANRYTRVVFPTGGGPELVEIPLDAIHPYDISVDRILYIDSAKLSKDAERGIKVMYIEVEPLRQTLQQMGFTISVVGSWGNTMQGAKLPIFYDLRRPLPGEDQEQFLIVRNGCDEVELMLVMTLEILWISLRPVPYVDLKAIILESDEIITSDASPLSLVEHYRRWNQKARMRRRLSPSRTATAKMSNGLELEFVVLFDRVTNDGLWQLWAVPRSSPGGSMISSNAALMERDFYDSEYIRKPIPQYDSYPNSPEPSIPELDSYDPHNPNSYVPDPYDPYSVESYPPALFTSESVYNVRTGLRSKFGKLLRWLARK